jgi:Fuc2NAc and GlcNAc transferase
VTTLALLAMISGLVSLTLTLAVLSYATHHRILDHPVERSSHSVPTPRGGGLAVLAAAVVGLIVGVGVHLVEPRHAVTLGGGALVLGAIGWIDDTRGLNATFRLAVQIAVAVCTVFMWNGFPAINVGQSTLSLGAAGFLLGVIGIVWSINLFNFMDGIDGLAGSQAVLIFSAAAVLLWSKQAYSLGAVAVILAASAAGFLVWNWPPAKIFLGDVGSGPLGYLIAAIAVESENTHGVPILAFATLGGVFMADATITLFRRFVRGERPMEAHCDHAYQRLARAWGSHRPVTLAAAALTLVLSIMALVATHRPALVLPILFGAAAVLGGVLFATERRAPLARRARKSS